MKYDLTPSLGSLDPVTESHAMVGDLRFQISEVLMANGQGSDPQV